jgi:hypothetical protein
MSVNGQVHASGILTLGEELRATIGNMTDGVPEPIWMKWKR